MNVGAYILNGLLIGGSSLLHMIPWTRRMTSSISESSDSWTPSFKLRLAPASIGLQSSWILLVFLCCISGCCFRMSGSSTDLYKVTQLLGILALGVLDIGPFLKSVT